MDRDRPTGSRMALTLVAWVVGLLVAAAAIVAVSSSLVSKEAPVLPAATSLVPSATATVSAEPTVVPPVAPPVATPTAPVIKRPLPVPPPPPAPRVQAPPATAPAKTSTGQVVVIDAGHQAKGDSSLEPIGPGSSQKKPKVAGGASGVVTHNPESLINLQVALKLKRDLESRGIKVVMIRETQDVNIANSQRAKIANDAHAALFIRLHCDGSKDQSQQGLSTLVPGTNAWTGPIVSESKRAGGYVHRAVIAATGAKDRGGVNRGDLSGFNWSTVPTVLVEMGFLSSPVEDRKLATSAYQAQLARGLATGIEDYLKTK